MDLAVCPVCWTVSIKYCIRILTWNYRINNMGQWITKGCYMCIQWTWVLYSVVITWQSNPPIPQFNSPCNEFTSLWSMLVYNNDCTIFYYNLMSKFSTSFTKWSKLLNRVSLFHSLNENWHKRANIVFL